MNSWENNREAGDLRRYHAHYDVIVMRIYKSYILDIFGMSSSVVIIHSYPLGWGSCVKTIAFIVDRGIKLLFFQIENSDLKLNKVL